MKTILDIFLLLRPERASAEALTASEFAELDLPFFSGCQRCGATLGPYNAVPSKSGYIIGKCCASEEDALSDKEIAETYQVKTPRPLAPGQKRDETPAEYLRRVVQAIGYEHEGLLDRLPSVEALLGFFGLCSVYKNDFWSGCLQEICDGQDEKPALDFIAKYNLGEPWKTDVSEAVAFRRDRPTA